MQTRPEARAWGRAVLMALAVMLLASACAQGGGVDDSQATPSTISSALAGAELRSAMFAEVHAIANTFTEKQLFLDSLPPIGTTVEEWYAQAAIMIAAYAESLDDGEMAAGRLETLLDETIESGRQSDLNLDPELVRELVAEFNLWLEAERLQNDPNICRETLPPGSEDLLLEEAVGPEFADCLVEFLNNPLIQRGSFEAAVRIREIAEEMVNAWSN